MRQPETPTASFNELEYKFNECPEEELHDCWNYEFAREIEWARLFVAQQSLKTLKGLARTTYYSFLVFREWPAKLYLSIEKAKRMRLIQGVRPTIKELEASFLETQVIPKGIEVLLRDALEKTGRSVAKFPGERREMALFTVDWALPDRVLLKFFESYLKVYRPSIINPADNRGRNDPDAKRRQQLKYLGMFRLLRVHGNPNSSHKAFGREFEINKVDAWYRARKTIEEQIKVLSDEMTSRFAKAPHRS